MSVSDLEKLFPNHLKTAYDSEQQVDTLLPRMIRSASDEQLIDAYESHMAQAGEQAAGMELLTQTLLSRAFRLP